MAGTGQTGITGDPSDLPGTGSAQAKYIKIDVPDFNNAYAKTAGGQGSGQGSMRTYLRLGAIESSKGAPVPGGSAPKDKLYNLGKAPNAADLADLVRVVGGNPMLWSTTGAQSYNIAALNTAETNNSDNYYMNASTGYLSGYDVNTAPALVQGLIWQDESLGDPLGLGAPLQSGNSVSVTVGLVIPGQLSATMINAGTTGTTGDPYLQELVPSVYDSTGEDLVSLVKGFMDDSRMRSDGGTQFWMGRDVAIGTPFVDTYKVAVGTGQLSGYGHGKTAVQGGFSGSFPQGFPSPQKMTIDPELKKLQPAPFMMPTWVDPAFDPLVKTPPTVDPWQNSPPLPDWSLGGFPASTDLPPGVEPKFYQKGQTGPSSSVASDQQPFVPGWMVPIRLGGPQQSMWGMQATPNTSTSQGPLLGWDPHPAANANSPDWVGAVLAPGAPSTLPKFGFDDDGNKLGAGVPLDPRDPWGMTPLPGYGRIYPQLTTTGELLTPEAPNINAVSDWLAVDYRALETNQLNLKGGWRDHTDGNRITTTRGDKVEVIRGNYKLLVIGRQDGSKGSGFDYGGGASDTVLTGASSTDPTTLASITEYKLCDDGQYRSWSTTKKGSGTPKLSTDGITVTLPTGSVQVAETWGWKSYTYTGVEKLKILSGGAGPGAGDAKWFGRVKFTPGGDPHDANNPANPRNYKPIHHNSHYDPRPARLGGTGGFAAGPNKPIAGPDLFVKGGTNDDTRGIIWPVAETISESHTTKTYSATFVRDTVAITAGPMLTVPFSLENSTGAGELLDWPSGTQVAGYPVGKAPLQLPPNQGAVPSINAATGTVTYGAAPAPLVMDAFGAFPLGRVGPNLISQPGTGGGLSSDYPPSNPYGKLAYPGDPTVRMALEGTGIPIPNQPYQKVNSTTAETHVKTQIARTFADVTFAQSFTGKSYTQAGSDKQPNGLTNALTWVETTVAESHTTKSATAYNFVADQYTESHTGHQKTVAYVGGASGLPFAGGTATESITTTVGDTHTTTNLTGWQHTDTTISNGGTTSVSTIAGATSAINMLAGASSTITMTVGATSSISLLLGISSTIKVNASVDLSFTAALLQISASFVLSTVGVTAGFKTSINLPVKTKLVVALEAMIALKSQVELVVANVGTTDVGAKALYAKL